MFNKFRNRRPARPMSRPRLGIARLEDRTTPSVSAAMAGDTLVVSGSASDPGAQIRIVGMDQSVRVFDGIKQVADFKAVANIDVRPGAGSDLAIDLGTTVAVNDLTVRLIDSSIGSRTSIDDRATINLVRIG